MNIASTDNGAACHKVPRLCSSRRSSLKAFAPRHSRSLTLRLSLQVCAYLLNSLVQSPLLKLIKLCQALHNYCFNCKHGGSVSAVLAAVYAQASPRCRFAVVAAAVVEQTAPAPPAGAFTQPAGQGLGFYTGDDGYLYCDSKRIDDIRTQARLGPAHGL